MILIALVLIESILIESILIGLIGSISAASTGGLTLSVRKGTGILPIKIYRLLPNTWCSVYGFSYARNRVFYSVYTSIGPIV